MLFSALACLTLLLTHGPAAAAAGPSTPAATASELAPTLSASARHEFTARDGVHLSYTVFGGGVEGAAARPIVVSPGKGESAFRYLETAKELLARGYGPIFVLEHRGQGFSQHLTNTPNTVHVGKFHDYVSDFLQFWEGPLAKELGARGISHKPLLFAHSMGGAVANLALLERPDLVERVAYVAPMFDIKFHPQFLNFAHDAIPHAIASTLCFSGCGGTVSLPSGPGKNAVLGPLSTYTRMLEENAGIEAEHVSPQWLRESIDATHEVIARAGEQGSSSLIFAASNDKMVENATLYEYACRAHNCSLAELTGPHSLHEQESSALRKLLFDKLDEFYTTGKVQKDGACAGDFKLLFERNP
jgi:lysophospholipase